MSSVLKATSINRHVNTVDGVLQILNDVSISLRAGESLAIQGASGSGKSTLLSILAGLEIPQTGQVLMNDIDITELDEDQRAMLRANNVGFVFQSFYLISDLTALENVALPLELFGVKNAQIEAREWLTKLGLAERQRHFPAQLSGGEQQRVALCRAFAVKPSILFADEPTANLDAATAESVLEQLFALQSEFNTAMVVATHDQDLAKRCHRRLQLSAGRVVDGGAV